MNHLARIFTYKHMQSSIIIIGSIPSIHKKETVEETQRILVDTAGPQAADARSRNRARIQALGINFGCDVLMMWWVQPQLLTPAKTFLSIFVCCV